MIKTASAALCSVLFASAALAQAVTLTPADPQPTTGELLPGLAVAYAYGADGRTLEEARAALESAEPGVPLQGLSYLDGADGDMTLTATEAHKVAAAISGFIRFEEAGTFEVEFLSNDGLEASIGGQQVVFFDGVHGCDPAGVVEVEVPEAGWYSFEAVYFQRKGSACLLMDWNATGEMEPVPDTAFAHTAG